VGSRTAKKSGNANGEGQIRGAALEPVGIVRRELVSPNGEVVVVDVPVYPPFRLDSQQGGPARAADATRKGSGEAA
jgi:hypothetical protein